MIDRNHVLALVRKFHRGSDVEDLVQEVLLKLHLKASSYRGEGFSSWLYTVVRNTVINHVRWSTRHPESELTDRVVAKHGARSPAESRAMLNAAWQLVASKSTETTADIFWRRYILQESEAEIAESLGMTVAAVKARATRARLLAQQA